MCKKLENLLDYIRENKTWSEAEEEVAWEHIGWKYPLDERIADAIYDLIDDYKWDNDLSEDWGEDYDAEELFWKL